MFEWEGETIEAVTRLMARRDPKRYRLGMLTAGPWPPEEDTGVMQWFANRSELSQFLPRVEPRRWGADGLSYIELRDALQECAVPLQVSGPTEALRERVNACAAPEFGIRWWGTLDELREGRSTWARELFSALADPPPQDHALPPRRVSELLALVARRYPLDASGPDRVD